MIPVFCAGTGRSGTTVLRKALGRHPDVAAMPGELRMVVDPDGLVDAFEALGRAWDPYRADQALHRLRTLLRHVTTTSTDRYRNHNTDAWVGDPAWYEERVDQLLEDLSDGFTPGAWTGATPGRDRIRETAPSPHLAQEAITEFVRDLYRRRNPDATHWVEDTPYTGCHWPRVRELFPDAKLVVCVRHPLDVLASFIHGGKNWTPKDPAVAAARISRTMHRTLNGVNALYRPQGSHVYLWRLEDVLGGPEARVAALCRFLGLRPHPNCADAYDPDRAHAGRWRDELTDAEERVGRDHLSWAISLLGYRDG